jgi:hypothetical protein
MEILSGDVMETVAKKVFTIIIGILLLFLGVYLLQIMESASFPTILLLVGIGTTIYGFSMKTKFHPKKVSPLSAFKKQPAKEPLTSDNDDN